MYIRRAYQSPCSGTHCAVQWAQMPNLASRNQSGARVLLQRIPGRLKGPEASERRDGCRGAPVVQPAEEARPRDSCGQQVDDLASGDHGPRVDHLAFD